jgi:predicted nicotinamide N-methyase
VGLVIWQSSIVLADLLLRRPPYGQGSWPGVSVLELGCGPGVVGMALALAGARVVMTDLPHVTPLTRVNVEGNCGHAACGVPRVVDHAWGGDAAPLLAALAARGAGAGGDGGVQRAGTGGAAAAAAAAAAPGADGLPAAGQAAGVGAAAAAAAVAVQPGAAAAAAAAGFDLIVAADCVYEPPFYADLLSTLRAVAAPHACVVMAHRMRGLGEAGFPAAAQAAGWAVEQLPPHLLHQEFRDGSYLVLRLAWLG